MPTPLRSILGSANRWVVADTNTTMVAGTGYLAVSSGSLDPNWSQVAMLLSFDGNFTDQAGNSWTALNGFTTVASPARFGSGAGNWPTGAAVLSTPSAARFNMAGDFCLDFWFYRPSGLGASNVFGRGGGGIASEWICYLAADGSMRFYTSNADLVSTGPLPTNTWSAIRFNRSGSTVAAYLDGARIQTASNSSNFNAAQPVSFGIDNQSATGAAIDEVRLTVGHARETGASYTVATSAFPGGATPIDLTVPATTSPGDFFAVNSISGSTRVLPGAGRQIGTAGVGTAVTLTTGQTLRIVARNATQLDIV